MVEIYEKDSLLRNTVAVNDRCCKRERNEMSDL
jgi:hypothetical protein